MSRAHFACRREREGLLMLTRQHRVTRNLPPKDLDLCQSGQVLGTEPLRLPDKLGGHREAIKRHACIARRYCLCFFMRRMRWWN